uniref:Uncharacterized protein n=1 Tax=Ditylum brightwellii TaxID=49249 RepID=A0A6V2EWA7_9STRA|mmetsp:Transcript_10699/g.15529  ORF Transcript_10699/g.15529 Transcript_10699/m.15529 type:complete len:113 (-) Transcript_10699:144-482(-)
MHLLRKSRTFSTLLQKYVVWRDSRNNTYYFYDNNHHSSYEARNFLSEAFLLSLNCISIPSPAKTIGEYVCVLTFEPMLKGWHSLKQFLQTRASTRAITSSLNFVVLTHSSQS